MYVFLLTKGLVTFALPSKWLKYIETGYEQMKRQNMNAPFIEILVMS